MKSIGVISTRVFAAVLKPACSAIHVASRPTASTLKPAFVKQIGAHRLDLFGRAEMTSTALQLALELLLPVSAGDQHRLVGAKQRIIKRFAVGDVLGSERNIGAAVDKYRRVSRPNADRQGWTTSRPSGPSRLPPVARITAVFSDRMKTSINGIFGSSMT